MRIGSLMLALVAGSMLYASTPAWAGEAVVGAEPLQTEGSGKITKAARAAAVTQLEAEPGDDLWVLHLWAKIDNGAEGPLYIEIGKTREGRRLVSKRVAIDDYAADKYVSSTVELHRSDGFRPDQRVQIAFVQNIGGKDAIKAQVELDLKASSAPPPKEEAEPQEEPQQAGDEEAEEEAAEPDPAPTPAAPPPVESGDKKGCSVAAPAPASAGMLVLLGLVAARRRRR